MTTLAALVWSLCAPPAFAGSQAIQTFELRPGWNAIFLTVQPEPHDPATVFQDLAIESAWAWLDRNSTAQYIQNPSEPAWGQPGWSAYFKPQARAFLTNLHAVFANRPYLLNLTGSHTVTWEVSGVPTVGGISWVPDSLNLVGFAVDPGALPAFAQFLGPSPAHAGQPVYRLDAGGTWRLLENQAAETVRAGEAYWVYCKGGSTYQGPLELSLPLGGGLDYGASLTELSVTLRNRSSAARAATFTLTAPEVPLDYRRYNASTGYFEWLPLADMGPLQIDPDKQATVRLAVRREGMASGLHSGLLEVSDGSGTLFLVPVSAEKVGN